MGGRVVWIVMVLALMGSACGGGDETATPPEDTTASTAPPSDTAGEEPATTTTQEPATSQPEEPTTDSGGGDGVGGVILVIGGETWEFDEVDFCAIPPGDPATTSLILVANQGDWQLIAQTIDDSGDQRLEGDGVYDTISLQNNADPTQSWLANNEAALEKFIVVEGDLITASASFDAVTGLSDDTPGTLEATCS